MPERILFIAALLAAFFAVSICRAAPGARVDYNHHIKPLLSDRCYACHGPDEKARKAKLRLDQKADAFRLAADGTAIIKPGDSARSELYRRIVSTNPDEKMPPAESHLSLVANEIALLKSWIEQGAEWTKHWSLVPVGRVAIPEVTDVSWPVNGIDRFILARLDQERLKPSPHASKERLLRRVTFDLTGLPPTLGDIDAFLADNLPGAYERVVDRLLSSSAYGERMAADWLDVARYADTHGYQADRNNHLWPWRDWVIAAFNRNVPFDDLILWQIAGDLLPGATREQKLATAFNRLHRQTNEGGSVEEEFRSEYVADRVHTAAGAFLGLTMECARCHDHKYDPISQKEYYQLFAFFNSTDESGLYSHFTDAIPSPTLLLYKDSAQELKHRGLNQAISEKERALANRRAEATAEFSKWVSGLEHVPKPQGLLGHYAFDITEGNKSPNALGTNYPAQLNEAPQLIDGRNAKSLRFNGENSVTINKVADFKRVDPFSFTFWMKIPEELDEIVVLHHQQAGSDAGYHGYQFVLEKGHASFALIHFWPGNAIKVRTAAKLPLNEWLHCGITYDGSSRAAGIRLHLNGQSVEVEVLRDNLFKDIANGQPLTLGARFRGRGFKDGWIDDLKIYGRALTTVEVRQDWDPAADAKAQVTALRDLYLATVDEPSLRLAAELRKLRQEENALINAVPEIMVMGDRAEPRRTFVLKRGLYDSPGESVTPGTPANILAMDDALPRNRWGLGRWLIDERNPLTARVIVNRSWQMFFGKGIVESSDNLGSQGTLPSHPELLDYLARRFIDSGWNLKALQKLIVTSATYRQASEASPELRERDPDNRLLARGPRNRLGAEMLRDQALAVSGLLVRRVGGPSVRPYQPEGIWEEKSASWKYEPDKGQGLYRRSLYTYWKRTVPPPSMIAFDASERNNCTVNRQNTSTPLQPLVLLNDPQFVEAARKLAERALKEGGSTVDDRAVFMFRAVLGRVAADNELLVLKRLFEEQLELFASDHGHTKEFLSIGESRVPSETPELAALASVALAVLNHDEAVLKR